VNVWRQQKVDELRQHVAALLARRAALAADTAQANAVRQLDDQIAEHCTAIADFERQLRATS
jgi:hypothetical protein